MIILGPKTAILGPQFCRILVLGPHFWWSGGAQAPGAPLDPPLALGWLISNTGVVFETVPRENQSGTVSNWQMPM